MADRERSDGARLVTGGPDGPELGDRRVVPADDDPLASQRPVEVFRQLGFGFRNIGLNHDHILDYI